MIYNIIYIFIFFYLNLTIKSLDANLTNIRFSQKLYISVSKLIIISFFTIFFIIFFIENSFIYFIVFYYFFFPFFLVRFRFEFLRIVFFFIEKDYISSNNFYYDFDFFLYKNFGYVLTKKLSNFKLVIKKIYLIFVPFLIFFFPYKLIIILNVLILVNFRLKHFNPIFDKALQNICIEDDEFILIKPEGFIKIKNYKKYLIFNIMTSKFTKKFNENFIWYKDYIYLNEKFNNIRRREFNVY